MIRQYGQSSSEEMITQYGLKHSYETLFSHMLVAIYENHSTAKADAHLALCVKYAINNGCDLWSAYNCYDRDNKDESDYSDFYLFRAHTRSLTDYLDEHLKWDMKTPVTVELVNLAVDKFLSLCSTYKFKDYDND